MIFFMQKKDGAQKENNVSVENEKRVNRPELVRKEDLKRSSKEVRGVKREPSADCSGPGGIRGSTST